MKPHGLGWMGLALALSACGPPQEMPPPMEQEADTVCALDGLRPRDYPGPKGQLRYASGATDFFCDPIAMLAVYLNPKPRERIIAAYVQDAGRIVWEKPEGYWIDAPNAYYVIDSGLRGALGPTFAPFAQEAEARGFIARHGGTLLRFDQLMPDQVDVSGGARHDESM